MPRQKTQKPKHSPAEEHILRAYRSNVKSRNDPKVREVLELAGKTRSNLVDYDSIISALNEVKASGAPPITVKDLKGATCYTTPKAIDEFTKEYGFEPPALGIKIPARKWKGKKTRSGKHDTTGLAEKLGVPSWGGGDYIPAEAFSSGPYNETGLILLSSTESKKGGFAHELIHSIHDSYQRQQSLPSERDNDAPAGSGEYSLISEIEKRLVSEISAYRSNVRVGPGDWCNVKRVLNEKYVPAYEGILPNELETKRIMETVRSKVDAAVDAVQYMQDAGVPEVEITRRLLATGPTKYELSNQQGVYYSPLKDVAAWGDYTRKKVEAAAGKTYLPKKKA